MVDVSAKPESVRRAVAEGTVRLAPATVSLLARGSLPKGDALAVARIAGIQGAKRAADLVPLCHPLRLDAVAVDLVPDRRRGGVTIRAEVTVRDRTGCEIEALAAVQAAALALYDMVKAVDRGAEITDVRLVEKSGGRSGAWTRSTARKAR
jgi:cyclic pyranopterin phosphate synthase